MAVKAMKKDEVTLTEIVERESKARKDLSVLSESSKKTLIMVSTVNQCEEDFIALPVLVSL